jgi:hypothetical protein
MLENSPFIEQKKSLMLNDEGSGCKANEIEEV